MRELRLSPAAAADLDAIWDYTAEHWSADQADRYTDDIRDACHALAAGRKTGRATDVRPGYLTYTLRAHIIYFRDRDNGIEVIRILHQRMDADRHL